MLLCSLRAEDLDPEGSGELGRFDFRTVSYQRSRAAYEKTSDSFGLEENVWYAWSVLQSSTQSFCLSKLHAHTATLTGLLSEHTLVDNVEPIFAVYWGNYLFGMSNPSKGVTSKQR